MSKGKLPQALPLTPATVSINGSNYGPRSTIWAGLRWSEARDRSEWHSDPHLSVPFCHIDEDERSEDCGWYRIRSKDDRYAFAKATNGAWVLRLTEKLPSAPG